jgi:hypothetical protein
MNLVREIETSYEPLMQNKLTIGFFTVALAGCVSASGPQYQIAQDQLETRTLHRKLVANAIKDYNFFQHYVFSQPNQLVIQDAQFGKAGGIFGVTNKDKAEYCVFIRVDNPENVSTFSASMRTFKAQINQQVDKSSNLQAVVSTGKDQPMGICVIAERAPMQELAGHVYRRN